MYLCKPHFRFFFAQRLALILVAAFLMIGLLPSQVLAVNPDEVLSDPILENRARELSGIIRCMKCQNQSIDDSDADLAKDLRILVRERLVEGDSDQQVLDYLVNRYGEFVLLKPKFSLSNMMLWGAPFLALLLGVYFSLTLMRRRQTNLQSVHGSDDLSRSEHDKLTKILDERD